MEMIEMKLIGLEDLPDNFKVVLEGKFRKELFEIAVKSVGGFLKLSTELKMDHSSLTKIRRGYRLLKGRKSPAYMRITLLKNLLKISGISIKEAEKNVIGLLTNKTVVNTKLPICSSKELASIIGHVFGDGHVSNQRFKYVNKRKELVNEVKKNTKLVFGYKGREYYIKNKNCYGIAFPSVMGHLLLILLRTTSGRKTIKETLIPNWIKNGSDEIKVVFLRALFDDDGSVCICKHQDFISISQYKDINLIKNHKIYLSDLRKMLQSLKINPSKISKKKDWKNTRELGFRIYGYKNLINFLKRIDFTHLLKHQKLIEIIINYG